MIQDMINSLINPSPAIQLTIAAWGILFCAVAWYYDNEDGK